MEHFRKYIEQIIVDIIQDNSDTKINGNDLDGIIENVVNNDSLDQYITDMVTEYYEEYVKERDNQSAMTCPSCGAELEYRPLDNPHSLFGTKVTHTWDCKECPMKMIEWYDSTDSIAVVNGVIKDEI